MVLLESLTLDNRGYFSGFTDEGRRIEIHALPHPEAISGKSNYAGRIDIEMKDAVEDLKMTARMDAGKYYFIDEEGEHFENKSIFVIPYVTFLIKPKQ